LAEEVVLEVARRMYAQAELHSDGTRVFRGSPRSLMEQLGSSSGRGPNAEWLVPPSVP